MTRPSPEPTLRRAGERGHAEHGWLDSWHTFSFADYHDPAWMHFRSLRVINEDVVAPGTGFGMHPHRDMEILTWILSGSLRHEDSMGHSAVIRPGDAQIMSAGTGILHSEHNASPSEPVHLLQVWLLPERRGLEPRYHQVSLPPEDLNDRLAVVAAPPGEAGAVVIHQDARVLAGRLGPGKAVAHEVGPGRHVWLQVARGTVDLDGTALQQGDGAALRHPAEMRLRAGRSGAEVLLFDLA